MKAGIYKLFDGGLIYVRKDRTVSATAGTNYPIQIGAKVKTLEGGKYVLAETGDKQFQGDRHADVPNGCTDHQALVDSMHMAANLEPGQRVVDYGTKFARVEQIEPEPGEFVQYEPVAEPGAREAVAEKWATGGVVSGKRPAPTSPEELWPLTRLLDGERRFVGVPPALAAPYGETDLVEWRKKFSASLRKQGFRICHKVSARKHRKRGHTVVPLHDNWFAWRPVDYLHPYQRDLVNRFKGLTLKVPAGVGKTEMMAVPRTLIYVGPLEHLKGKKALTMPARSSGVLLAQFDDINATRSGEPLPKVETLEYEPHARFPTVTQTDPPEPPVDALGFHWHEFPSADFAAAGA